MFKISNRQYLSAAIIVFYFIPLLFFSAYSIRLMSQHKSWALLSIGLLLVVFGTVSLIFLLANWEESLRDKKLNRSLLLSHDAELSLLNQKETKVTSLDPSLIFEPIVPRDLLRTEDPQETSKELNLLQTALESSQKQQEELIQLLEMKEQEILKLEEENKELQIQAQQIGQDFADYKLFSEEQRKQKQLQLSSFQQMIEDQKNEMEKRQEQIHQLDTKVHDLSYEIKTLLYLHDEESVSSKPGSHSSHSGKNDHFQSSGKETHFENQGKGNGSKTTTPMISPALQPENLVQDSPVQTPQEAAQLLKKCIHVAQKLTGANYYSNESSRYREFSSSYFAIDQRRLFDSLRAEKGALVVVYSQKDQKLLFANNEVKTLLGWGPEKFLTEFSSIMHEGIQEWKKALQIVSTGADSQARLLAKTRQGQEIFLNCHLGVVTSGLFRNYIIGILYPAV